MTILEKHRQKIIKQVMRQIMKMPISYATERIILARLAEIYKVKL